MCPTISEQFRTQGLIALPIAGLTVGEYSLPATVRIVVGPPEKALHDLNADGGVDVADLSFLMESYGNSAAKIIEGDFDGDGRISMRDGIVLRNAFTPSPAPAAMLVARLVRDPQPAQEENEPLAIEGVRHDRRAIRRGSAQATAATDRVFYGGERQFALCPLHSRHIALAARTRSMMTNANKAELFRYREFR
jgi:hypothetical protein